TSGAAASRIDFVLSDTDIDARRAQVIARSILGTTMRLRGKSAIITGAAGGIGKNIALVFAREGAKVAIADLNKDAAEAAANEIRGSGGQAMGVAMDVTDEQAVNDGVAAVVRSFGGVDILISNAGIQIVHPIEEFSYAE